MTDVETTVFAKALGTWGAEAQIAMVFEEMNKKAASSRKSFARNSVGQRTSTKSPRRSLMWRLCSTR